MENNTKTILLAVFILLIAIVSFNFTSMTGDVSKETYKPSVVKIISPVDKIVHRKDAITVQIIPGSEGVNNRKGEAIWIYSPNGMRVSGTDLNICGRSGNVCTKLSEVTYSTLDSDDERKWPLGKYNIGVEERGNGKIIRDTFELKE